ncbi:aspartic peptidase A1 [Lactarius sanguifluus]|nr:aspartic peptidase A1 [Lactarius sanguifluus]
MFPTASLTAFLLLAVSVAANPIVIRKPFVSLSFARHLNVTGAHDLVQKDQARAKNFVSVSKAKQSGTLSASAVISVGVTNVGVVYEASVGVGTPPTLYNLLIDTGSSNTWVGAGKAYVRTSTSVQTIDRVAVTYGSGSFSGTEFQDFVTIGTGLGIFGQSIGVASTSTGFDGFDGILGIGPVDLTLGTLSPESNALIPTVTDNLFSQGTITSDLVSVYFEPTTTTSVKNGELTFGGTDSTKFTGALTFIPNTGTFPASEFWGINESIRYGASTSILSTTAGIVDTGTTLILIATDAFNRYKTATGAVLDGATGLLKITLTQFNNLQSLFFTTGGTSFELTANAQIWPRALNTFIGGTSGSIYLVVNDIGSPTGSGLDFINGYTFLERFYSVFDTTNRRVGFATTAFTTATTN